MSVGGKVVQLFNDFSPNLKKYQEDSEEFLSTVDRNLLLLLFTYSQELRCKFQDSVRTNRLFQSEHILRFTAAHREEVGFLFIGRMSVLLGHGALLSQTLVLQLDFHSLCRLVLSDTYLFLGRLNSVQEFSRSFSLSFQFVRTVRHVETLGELRLSLFFGDEESRLLLHELEVSDSSSSVHPKNECHLFLGRGFTEFQEFISF